MYTFEDGVLKKTILKMDFIVSFNLLIEILQYGKQFSFKNVKHFEMHSNRVRFKMLEFGRIYYTETSNLTEILDVA